MIARFWAKVSKPDDPDGCWMWDAGCTKQGYGGFHPTKQTFVLAHRYSYELQHGPIPAGVVVDHECHNKTTCPGGNTCPHRKCVNPAHLTIKTNAQNLLDGPNHNSKKTHCPRNHEYTEANTYVNASGGRVCTECRREYDRTPQRVQAHREYRKGR